MEHTRLHTLSTRKLLVLLAACCLLFVALFVVGDLVTSGSTPSVITTHVAKPCRSAGRSEHWFDFNHCSLIINNVTFRNDQLDRPVFYITLPRQGNRLLTWNQFILTTLRIKLGIFNFSNMNVKDKRKPHVQLSVHTRLGYWNLGQGKQEWIQMISSEKTVQLICDLKREGTELWCPMVPYFELDSVHHSYYVINMRFSVDLMPTYSQDLQLWVKQVESRVTVQRTMFTQASFALKLIYCPVSLLAVTLYLWRAKKYRNQMSTLEKSMVFMGATLAFFNLPIEWLTVWLDIPPMMLLVDIRLVIFYGVLFYFTSHFIGQQMKEKPVPLDVKIFTFTFKVRVADVGIPIVTFLLVLYHLIDRITILDDHFYSMVLGEDGVQALLAFVISVGAWTGLYMLYVTSNAVYAIRDIKEKQTGAIKKAMIVAVIANIVVAWLTVLYFCISNIHWAYMKYHTAFHVSGALFTGIVGAWNIFVAVVLFLFAPCDTATNQESPATPTIAQTETTLMTWPLSMLE